VSWVGSAAAMLLVVAGLAAESALLETFAASALGAAPLGAWGVVLPAVGARGGVSPSSAAGGLGAPSCDAAGAALPFGGAAGFAFGLAVDGWEEAWPCEGALPTLFAAGFVDPLFVAPPFVGAAFVDAGFVGAEFVDGEFIGPKFVDAAFVGALFSGARFGDAEFAGAGLGAGFAGAGLAAGGGLTGAGSVSGALVASSNAANGWESVCGADSAGVSACDHCDWLKDDVELTSDAILDTAKPLRSEKRKLSPATAGPARRAAESM